MIKNYAASFDGHEPFGTCNICGGQVNSRGHCDYCHRRYEAAIRDYNFPEPFTRDTFTPEHWKKIYLMRKECEALGFSKHDTNAKIFTFAYHASFPAKGGTSPYLQICDIPTAPTYVTVYRGTGRTCPVCKQSSYDSAYCSTCANRYSDERFHSHFPEPFTQRIFHFSNWQDIQLIKQRGQDLHKTPEEINQAISEYARQAVAEMQASASSRTTAAEHIFPLPAPTPAPPRITPPRHASPPTNQTTRPTPQPTPSDNSFFDLQQRYANVLKRFQYGTCHVCGQWKWTKSGVRGCCANDPRKNQPVAPRPRPPIFRQPLSPYRFSNPCPVCHGEGYIRGVMCPDCDGRGSLRIW